MLTVKMGEAMEGKEEEGESEREGEWHSTLLREEQSDTSAGMYLAKCEGASAYSKTLWRYRGAAITFCTTLPEDYRSLGWPLFHCGSGALPCQVPVSYCLSASVKHLSNSILVP